MRTRGTQPALPGATLPTASIATPSRQQPAVFYEPKQPPKKRPNYAKRAIFQLLGLWLLMEGLFLACYPLFANATPVNDVAKQALLGLFPWLPQLYWTGRFPQLAQELTHVAAFDPTSGAGSINLLFLLQYLAFGLMLIAGWVGRRVTRERLARTDARALFLTVLILTLIFGITYLFIPGILTQDMFAYGTYGRLVAVYHVNPYVASFAGFPHDLLHAGLAKSTPGTVPPGPVWLDLSLPVVLVARGSVANVLMGFRLLGFAAHLANAGLIWLILARLRPETRIFATLLYAWNPLVLLVSIGGMHLEVILILCILLAVLFFQRHSPMLGWVFILLALLMSIWCLLLLPLFFLLFARAARPLRGGRRALWWLASAALTALVVVLAYAPYWSGWGLSGLLTHIQRAFFEDTAINSLDAALLSLPVKLPPALAWIIVPHHWTIFAAIVVIGIVLLGLWLVDNVELVVLFSGWVLLALFVVLPISWPWYIMVPLALALCSASGRTLLLALLLTLGALGSCYFWLWQPLWPGQALVTMGLPLLLWGWLLFFISTWEMTHVNEPQESIVKSPLRGLSRPSRPSRPPRRQHP